MNIYAQGLQAISSATFGGSSPVAMLSDFYATSCCYQSGGSGNIEAVGTITAGTYDFGDL